MQNYKEAIVRRGHEESGPHWGNATGFNKMDWTDHNEQGNRI
jgi:hypothetical protein